MRCQNCQVDLPESYDRCPLCGEPAANEPAALDGIAEGPYPEAVNAVKPKRRLPNRTLVFLASALICVVFCVLGKPPYWAFYAPLLILGWNIYLFICALKEKGRLLHAAVLLFALAGLELLLVLLALLLRHAYATTLFLFVVSAAALLILYAVRTDRFTAQVQALFHL